MSDPTLQQLLDWVQSHWFGKYRGVVTDTQDSASMGRIEVQVPAVLGDVRVWAMPCVPYAGDGVGFWFIPDVGAGVWVEFEGGDPCFPIWSGCFWGDGQAPADANPAVKVLETAVMVLQAKDDDKEVVIERKDGAKTTMTDTLLSDAIFLWPLLASRRFLKIGKFLIPNSTEETLDLPSK